MLSMFPLGLVSRSRRTPIGYAVTIALAMVLAITGSLLVPNSVAGASSAGYDGIRDAYVCNVATGRYLDADGANGNSGHYNVSTSLSPTGDDEWRLTALNDGRFVLRNREKHTFLDSDGADKGWNVDGSRSIRDDDKWEIRPSANGTVALFNTYRGQYLNALGEDQNWNVNTVPAESATTVWIVVSLAESCYPGMVVVPPTPLSPVSLRATPPTFSQLQAPVIRSAQTTQGLGTNAINSYGLNIAGLDGQGVLSGDVTVTSRPFNFIAAVDISQSTVDGRPGCGGDVDLDGVVGSVADCELLAVKEIVDRISSVDRADTKVGVVAFSASAAAADVNPGPGYQVLAAANADVDRSGTADIDEVITSLQATGFMARPSIGLFTPTELLHGTNYHDAVKAVCGVAAQTPGIASTVVFFSDGRSLVGGGVDDLLPCSGATFHTVAVGSGASCETGDPSLQRIADLTGGSCTAIADLAELPQAVPDLVVPETIGLTVSLDGGTPIDVATPAMALPRSGDLTWRYDLRADAEISAALDAAGELCVTALVAESGELTPVTACSLIERADASLIYSWTPIEYPGDAPVLADVGAESPVFQPSEPGRYVFEVTMTDSLQRVWPDRVEVTVVSTGLVRSS